jgi:hypothetical protein
MIEPTVDKEHYPSKRHDHGRQVGMQEKLYSSSFERFITPSLSILLRSFYVKLSATNKTYKKTVMIKFWKHAPLPI